VSQFVEVMLDTAGLEEELREMGRTAPLIMARALNRAATTGRAAMVKVMKQDTGIASKNIRKEISIDKANRTRPVVRVEIKGRRIPLIAFQAKGPEPSRGRGRGVSYRLPTGRGRIPNAFIATMPSGHRGVYKRKRTRRLPIRELFGPSLPHVFDKFLPTFRQAASEALAKNLRSELNFARSRFERKGA
jgi:hypothetical protein